MAVHIDWSKFDHLDPADWATFVYDKPITATQESIDDLGRQWTLYLRTVWGDATRDSKEWDYETTFFKIKIAGNYEHYKQWQIFPYLYQTWMDNDKVSYHTTLRSRYNKTYGTWNVKLGGRPGRDMWYSVPKKIVHEEGPPRTIEDGFTWDMARVMVKNDKVIGYSRSED